MKQILINTEGLQTRVAVVENGKLQEFFIERKDRDRLAGSIFKGRIKNLEPSLQAAFVDIGTDKNAFLHYWDMLPATKEVLEGGSSRDEEDAEAQEDTAPEARPVVGNGQGKGWMALIAEKLGMKLQDKTAPVEPRRPPPPQRRRQGRTRSAFKVEDIPNLFKVESEVIVQVSKGPIGNKGARVTTNLSIPGRYLVLLPNATLVGVSKRVEDHEERERLRHILRHLRLPPNMGVICRTVGAGKKEKYFQRDLEILTNCWSKNEAEARGKPAPCCIYQEPDLVERVLRDHLTEDIDEIVADSKTVCEFADEMVKNLSREERVRIRLHDHPRPLFDRYNLTEQIENIFRRRVPLPGGGYICIDETEALISIDVNSGRNRAGKDHPETILNTNIEAAEEIARQLRIRNLGGLIVIDFIDMRSRRDQHTVYARFKAAMQTDRARNKIYPISPLGLLEMTRQREDASLRSALFSPCPYCNGKGVVKSATSISVEIQRRLQEILRKRKIRSQVRVTVHPQILERLKNEDAGLLTALEKEFGGELSFRAEPSLHIEEFHIVDAATGQEL